MSDKRKSAWSTRLSNLLSDEVRAAMKETLEERRRALSGEGGRGKRRTREDR